MIFLSFYFISYECSEKRGRVGITVVACWPILYLVWWLERLLRVRGSLWGVRGAYWGMWEKSNFFIILDETFWLNCSTCLRMYSKKASEDQRPISMIVYTGISSRYIAMAAPDLMEWVPISDILKPSDDSPIECAAARRECRASVPETWRILLLS